MSSQVPISGSSGSATERELYRYFQPPNLPEHMPTPRASHDTSLTAFAQLGSLKLEAKRAFIALGANDREYIVAEAGQSLSLQDASRHAENDELWRGVCRLPPEVAVCHKFTNVIDQSLKPAEKYIMIPDLLEDKDFGHLAYRNGILWSRFLTAFPIRTTSRIIIGYYAVVDLKPRQGLTAEQVEFMRDMAATVMDHFENQRMRHKHMRAEAMVKALGLFIEGQGTIRDWWVAQESQRRAIIGAAKGTHIFETPEAHAEWIFGVQEEHTSFANFGDNQSSIHSPDQLTPSTTVTIDPMSTVFTSPSTTDSRIPLLSSKPGLEKHHSYDTAVSMPTTVSDDTGCDPVRRVSVHPPEELHYSASCEDSGRSLQQALLTTQVRDCVARAANLIREAVQLDGAIFYDATLSSFGASAREGGDETAPGSFSINAVIDGATSSSENDLRRTPTKGKFPNGLEDTTSSSKGCNILGYSTRTRSALNGHPVPAEHELLSEKFLRSLLKKYPHGKVYQFHEDGSVASSDSDASSDQSSTPTPRKPSQGSISSQRSRPQRKKGTMSREAEAHCITQAFPGARSLVFYPLWDAARERWFSGGFLWTKSPYRVLCAQEDLPYLVSFGNSIMSEIARISATLSSQMKNDFVSSISHELRSPLHGILASVELLEESGLTLVQEDLVTTINSCGKTLLDTINHVLDFSKVNRKAKDAKTKYRNRVNSTERKGQSVVEEPVYEDNIEDLAVLTEEVVESVYAAQRLSWSEPGHRRSVSAGGSAVSVIIDARWRSDWRSEIDGGAWRRVVMNLVGNALKYTTSGFVRVVLKPEETINTKEGLVHRPAFSLTVTDSGKGISKEFLKTHLFTPFAQEDALSPGTGLGLSIVRQIIRDLGGTIKFTSEQGSGTEARVVIPINTPNALCPAINDKSNVMLAEVYHRTANLTTCLVAFDTLPDISETPTGLLSPAMQAKFSVKEAIQSMMREWFGSHLINSPVLNPTIADIHLIPEHALTADGQTFHNIRCYQRRSLKDGGRKIVVILCVAPPLKQALTDGEGLRVVYVQQPHGPHKIAAALHHALFDRLADSPPALPIRSNPSTNSYKDTPDSSIANVDGKQMSIQLQPVVERAYKVLLVEDNIINLKLLETYMRKLKLQYSTASNGLEALHQYQSSNGNFDIILMDISMPVMDGLASSRKIRQHENEYGLPSPAIIALTGAATSAARQEAFSAGIDLFLTKPVPLKRLKEILNDFMTHGREGLIGSLRDG